MISYFYDANYNPSQYDKLEALLHAQVVIIADKQGCESLCELAISLFRKAITEVKNEDILVLDALIRRATSIEIPVHVQLRDLAYSRLHYLLLSLMSTENARKLYSLNLDNPKEVTENHLGVYNCNKCRLIHLGCDDCSHLVKKYNLT